MSYYMKKGQEKGMLVGYFALSTECRAKARVERFVPEKTRAMPGQMQDSGNSFPIH
jgi:hypothetical protein